MRVARLRAFTELADRSEVDRQETPIPSGNPLTRDNLSS